MLLIPGVSASESAPQDILSDRVYEGQINEQNRYYSFNAQYNTEYQAWFGDPGENALEFCIYSDLGLREKIGCFGGYNDMGEMHRMSRTTDSELHVIEVICTECELEGVYDVPYTVRVEYDPSTSGQGVSESVLLLVSFVLAGLIVIAIASPFRSKREGSQGQDLHYRQVHPHAQYYPQNHAGDEFQNAPTSTNVVQNITYNIQDSSIVTDEFGNIKVDPKEDSR